MVAASRVPQESDHMAHVAILTDHSRTVLRSPDQATRRSIERRRHGEIRRQFLVSACSSPTTPATILLFRSVVRRKLAPESASPSQPPLRARIHFLPEDFCFYG